MSTDQESSFDPPVNRDQGPAPVAPPQAESSSPDRQTPSIDFGSGDMAAFPVPVGPPFAVGPSVHIGFWVGLLLDIAVGFGCLMLAGVVVLVCAALRFHEYRLLIAGVFFVATYVRTIWSRTNPWFEGLAVSLGALGPVVLIAMAASFGRSPILWANAVALVLICGAAAQTRRAMKVKQPMAAVATLIALMLALGAYSRYVMPRFSPALGQTAMNQPAPPVTVTLLDGPPVTLASFRGRVVLIDFWDTWCGPCMEEMPKLVDVYRQYRSNPDVVFLAVNAGWENDTTDKVRETVARKHLDLPVALDLDGAARTLKVRGLPTLILIDRQGHIRMQGTGYDDDEPLQKDLASEIDALLKPSN